MVYNNYYILIINYYLFGGDCFLKTCIIFSGGTVTGTEYLPEITSDTFVISADGGYLNALKFNIIPNMCLGDFDTITIDINSQCEVVKFPPEKDDTDTMLCIKKAISMGYTDIYIYGALGGRFDHSIANVQSMEYSLQYNVTCHIVDAKNIVTMQRESSRVYSSNKDFKYLSILSLSESAEVSAEGLKYPLEHTNLVRSFPLGVSNETLVDIFRITVHSGTILVIYSKD